MISSHLLKATASLIQVNLYSGSMDFFFLAAARERDPSPQRRLQSDGIQIRPHRGSIG